MTEWCWFLRPSVIREPSDPCGVLFPGAVRLCRKCRRGPGIFKLNGTNGSRADTVSVVLCGCELASIQPLEMPEVIVSLLVILRPMCTSGQPTPGVICGIFTTSPHVASSEPSSCFSAGVHSKSSPSIVLVRSLIDLGSELHAVKASTAAAASARVARKCWRFPQRIDE